MKDNIFKKISIIVLIITAAYFTGFALAHFKIISSQIYLTSSFGFRPSERPEIYGLIFIAELLIPVIGLFLGYALLTFLIKRNILFSAVGVLLISTGAYFTFAGILECHIKKLWETASMIGAGIFFICIGIILFKANAIFSDKKK